MNHLGLVPAGFNESPQGVGNKDRTMVTARAAHADHELALAFLRIFRKQELNEIIEFPQKSLGHGRLFNIGHDIGIVTIFPSVPVHKKDLEGNGHQTSCRSQGASRA